MTQINVFRKAISSVTSHLNPSTCGGLQARRYSVVSLLFLIASFWSAASYALTVTINDFSVVRNGSGFFTDDFADGNEPPSGPANPNLLSGNAYVVSGTIPDGAESGGVLLLDSANGILGFNAVGDPRFQVATFLRTDTSANLSVGLKSDDTLALTGIFSLTTPPGPLFSAYGIRFTDNLAGVTHQFAQLFVRFNEATNQAQITYVLQDFDPDIITPLGSTLFNPPAGADEILLKIERPSTSNNNFFGSFSYLDGGLVVGGGSFGSPAALFDDENFVRAQFFVSQDLPAVPEPSSIWLLIAGLGGLAAMVRARRS
jgi:PEP-CTERM motif-containing protein